MLEGVTPYRDEKETLRGENERLKAKLEDRRSRRVPRVAIALAALAIAAFLVLMPWLNGSDLRFWSAIGILVVLIGGALFATLRQT